MKKQPKIALVHDYIKEYGGAERVLETLHEMYPDAPVYTLIYAPQFLGPHKERFKNWKIHQSFLQYIPFSYKFISIYRLIAPFVFKTFDFSGFDVVIVSATGAYSPNMIRTSVKKNISSPEGEDQGEGKTTSSKKITVSSPHPSPLLRGEGKKYGPVHICYCHTPPRYLYGYATARELKKNSVMKVLVAIMNHILRMVDYTSSKNVDIFIANSQNIAGRIKKFYRRDAVVVYPPVDTLVGSSQKTVVSKKDAHYSLLTTHYYLAGGRLARPKHIDLIIRACKELHVPLKVFGKGFAGYGEELEKIVKEYYSSSEVLPNRANFANATSAKEVSQSSFVRQSFSDGGSTTLPLRSNNIEFLGEITDEEKLQLMANAKAFLFAAEDEDFGIVPVEAMSVGTPVIAYRSGGVLETVIDGKTGVFFDALTKESLMNAIKKFEKMKIKPEDCKIQAEKFSKERFEKEIKKVINNLSS